jgi:hypothetical protein
MSEATTQAAGSALAIVPAPEETVQRFTEAGATIQNRVDALVIATNEDVEVAKLVLDDIAALVGQVEGDLGGPKKRAHGLWRELSEVYNKHAEPLAKLGKLVRLKIADHYDEQDRLQRVKEAEEAAKQRKLDEDARLKEAEALAAAGDTEQAEEVLEEEPIAPSPAKRPEKVSGIARKKVFSAEVTGTLKVARAAIAGDAIAISILTDPAVVKAMSSAASKKAKALGASFKCDGVRLMSESQIAHRAS